MWAGSQLASRSAPSFGFDRTSYEVDEVSWVVRAPDRKLAQAEKKLYSRVRRVLWDYEPLRASHAEIFIDVEGDSVRLRGRVRSLPQKLIAGVLVERLAEVG